MFGKSSFEGFKRKGPSPEEILAAQRAADIANREKTERQLKERAEHEETLRLTRIMHDEQAKNSAPHEITEEDIKEAEKTVGQKFERLN